MEAWEEGMKLEGSVLGRLYFRKSQTIDLSKCQIFVTRMSAAPRIVYFASLLLGGLLGRKAILDSVFCKIPVVAQVSNFLFGNIELIMLSSIDNLNISSQASSESELSSSSFDVIVVGSGPGGSIAALRSLQEGKSVLLLEEGGEYTPGLVEHHSLTQTKKQFRNGGLNFIWGSKPVLFAEGKTLGGGSEVNSGLYHRLEGSHREKILSSLKVSEDVWSQLEELVEEELSVQLDPEGLEPGHGLVLGAKRIGMQHKEIPRWRKYDPEVEHQGMQVTYLRKARELGLQVISDSSVTNLVLTENEVIVNTSSKDKESNQFCAKEVILAAGTIETPRILNRSGLTRNSFKLNFHPMLRCVAEQPNAINEGDIFPSWQAWTDDLRLKFGYSVSTYPYLAATLRSMGVHSRFSSNDLSRMAAYFGSFALGDSRVRLIKVGMRLTPFIWWGKKDLKSLKEVTSILKKILTNGDAVNVWPKKKLSAVTTVHLFGSIPISHQDIVDQNGRLKRDLRIRISDASLMPHAPWGNPQGPVMVMCELLAKRNQ